MTTSANEPGRLAAEASVPTAVDPAVREALWDAIHQVAIDAWNLLDRTANSYPPDVDQGDWDALSQAMTALGKLIPESEQPASPSYAVHFLRAALAHTQQGGERDGAIGPRTITTSRQTCKGCSELVLKDWKFLGEDDELDIGTSAKCTAAADKPINSHWSERTPTPAWCPALPVAPTSPSKSSGEEA